HHVQHAEEYRQTPVVGGFLRWSRFLAITMSLFLLPLWLAIVLNHDIAPDWLQFLGPKDHKYHIPITIQVLIAELGVEIIRMAAIHTPSALSTALGLIAAVMIGQIGVQVGIFTPEVILYTSLAAIGGFATPSYELSEANRIVRIFLILVTAFFGIPGFVIGSTLFIIYLARVKNLNTPYLWPFIPFDPMAMVAITVRTSMPLSTTRPAIVKPLDKMKMPRQKQRVH
ncbi:MAG: spore germination protein, partial [Tuberibacillus sp.]